jgi:hypothetical protein
MKRSAPLLIIILILTLVQTAGANAPLPGIYKSTDLGGTILLGRGTESWPATGAGGQIGNTQHGASWDGSTLGTQWEVSCPAISSPPQVITDTRNANGDGEVTYRTYYVGGQVILNGTGEAWDGGDAVYTATVVTYVDITTYTFQSWVPVGSVTSVNLQATVDGYDKCVEFAIGNSVGRGATDYLPLPPDYPCFLDPNTCGCDRVRGGWGDVSAITMVLSGCAVPTEPTTWGSIKSMYR